jgi:hypothetical protein
MDSTGRWLPVQLILQVSGNTWQLQYSRWQPALWVSSSARSSDDTFATSAAHTTGEWRAMPAKLYGSHVLQQSGLYSCLCVLDTA